jgi:hypothetical protein
VDFAIERVFVGLDRVEAQPKERRLRAELADGGDEDAVLPDPLDGVIDEVLNFILIKQIVNRA